MCLLGCSNDPSSQTPKGKLLEGGVRLEVLTPSKGIQPEPGDWAFIDFETRLEDSTLIQSTYNQNRSVIYRIGDGSKVKGFETGLYAMHEGEEVNLFVPSSQAYGSQGIQKIPANANILYKLKLRKVFRPGKAPNWTFPAQPTTDEGDLKTWVVSEGIGQHVQPTSQLITSFAIYKASDTSLLLSSYTMGPPTDWVIGIRQFPLGIEKAVQQVGAGGKFRALCKGGMTYQSSKMKEIPANVPLIFDMEVIDFKPYQ